MQIRAASSRGILHRHQRTVRQDAFALANRALPGDELAAILVVCDGVGSLERSGWAAAVVSRRLAELGAAAVPWQDAYRQVNDELGKYAVSTSPAGGPLTMATTALAVSVRREGDDWVGEVAWVGDSPLWHLDRHGRLDPGSRAVARSGGGRLSLRERAALAVDRREMLHVRVPAQRRSALPDVGWCR